MADLYLDCEWNDHGGDLISLALISPDGRSFYQALECTSPSPWVAKNVIPYICINPPLCAYLVSPPIIHSYIPHNAFYDATALMHALRNK